MPRTPRTPKKGKAATSVSARPAWPDRFLTALKAKGTIAGAAQVANVGRRTVYDELARNPDFARDVQEIREACVELVEATLFECALDPDRTTDRIFYLKTAKPEVYGDGLRADQIRQIREEARRATLAEVQADVARLPEAARKIVMDAMAKASRELTP